MEPLTDDKIAYDIYRIAIAHPEGIGSFDNVEEYSSRSLRNLLSLETDPRTEFDTEEVVSSLLMGNYEEALDEFEIDNGALRCYFAFLKNVRADRGFDRANSYLNGAFERQNGVIRFGNPQVIG